MSGQVAYLFPVLPELVLLIAGCVVLMAGVFFPKKEHLAYVISQLSLVIVAVLLWVVYSVCGKSEYATAGICQWIYS